MSAREDLHAAIVEAVHAYRTVRPTTRSMMAHEMADAILADPRVLPLIEGVVSEERDEAWRVLDQRFPVGRCLHECRSRELLSDRCLHCVIRAALLRTGPTSEPVARDLEAVLFGGVRASTLYRSAGPTEANPVPAGDENGTGRCTICHYPLHDLPRTGDGDGAGQRFAHSACFELCAIQATTEAKEPTPLPDEWRRGYHAGFAVGREANEPGGGASEDAIPAMIEERIRKVGVRAAPQEETRTVDAEAAWEDDDASAAGMSLRDWFAGMALEGRDGGSFYADNDDGNQHLRAMVNQCYRIADAMLAARAPREAGHE